jgi:hypothetical protein
MVDAFSRLFGKSSKKHSSSSIPPLSPSDTSMPSPSADAAHNPSAMDEDGFTHLNTNGDRQQRNSGSDVFGYPALPREAPPGVPYPPTGGGPAYPPAGGGPAYATGTLASQYSMSGGGHLLDGVPFSLSGRCSTKTGGGGQDDFDVAVGNIVQRIENAQSILQSSTYDFQVERSVVDSSNCSA